LKKAFYIIFILLFPASLMAQTDTIPSISKLSFTSDFRFRIEQDWDSRKTDGSYRDDRTRLRYRLRAGFNYNHNHWASFGARIRTGNPKKQQDPQLTLGDGFKEFGTLPLGFEKIFFKAEYNGFVIWGGKNTFPFQKNNELFWSDNVYPEGVFLKKEFNFQSSLFNQLDIRGGHFIIVDRGSSFNADSHLQALQLNTVLFNQRIVLFPSFYQFKNIPNIPDGSDTFLFNYSIIHIGTKLKLSSKPLIHLEMDYYTNIEDYSSNDSIPSLFKNQKNGLIAAIGIGKLKEKGDWTFKLTYSNLQQYAAVDFLAQNDWARWDYSSYNSPDGRLTNFKGFEIVGGYMLENKLSLKMKYYLVNQIVAYGISKETGSRIRLDLDINF